MSCGKASVAMVHSELVRQRCCIMGSGLEPRSQSRPEIRNDRLTEVPPYEGFAAQPVEGQRRARTGMHLTDCVSIMPKPGSRLWSAARRRRRATSHSNRSNSPRSSHLRNQLYTVRHAGKSPGRARQGLPTRKCLAIALTTGRTGVARVLRDGSARSSHCGHLLNRPDRYYLRQARLLACPMRFGPHLCSSPPGQADTRDFQRIEMGLKRKRATQTGS